MYNGHSAKDLQKWLALLARAPLERLMPHSRIDHYTTGAVISQAEQLNEWTCLVLSGKCEHRTATSGRSAQTLQVFSSGQAFGGTFPINAMSSDSAIVAVENSVILRIRPDDLAQLENDPNGRDTGMVPRSADVVRPVFTIAPRKGRLAVLIAQSDLLPLSLLGESIAHRLRNECSEAVVLVRLLDETHSPGGSLIDCTLGADVRLPNVLREDGTGLAVLNVGIQGEATSKEVLMELLSELRLRFHHVLVTGVAEELEAAHLLELLKVARHTFLFLRRNSGDLYRTDLLMRELKLHSAHATSARLKPVLCLTAEENVNGFDARVDGTGATLHGIIRGCPLLTSPREPSSHGAVSGTFHADVRRIAREIGDRLIGLALASGGAKGFAHIGVIQVLEENGIEVDIVAGASMGAYVGSIWAYGYDGPQLEVVAREMEKRWALWSLIDPVIPPRQGFIRGLAVKRRLMRTIGESHFSDLVRPLRVVAGHLDTLDRVIFSRGMVADAVHASIAVPGICVPVRIGEELYIDGGIVDPLPTDLLHELGVRHIIAVNTVPTPANIRECLRAERELAQLATWRARKRARKIRSLDRHVNYFARGNILEILMHSIHGGQTRVAESSCERAEIVLRPEVWGDRWLDFAHPGRYIAAGRVIAEKHLDQIKAMLKTNGKNNVGSSPKSLAAVA